MPGITDPGEEYFKDGLWGWVSDQWKKLVADASNFLQVNVAAQDIDVEVKQTTAADLTPGIMGWDGSAWRKLPLLWGYSDRLYEDLGGTKSGDGNYGAYATAVPAGEVHVIEQVAISNSTGARGALQIRLYVGTSFLPAAFELTPARYVPLVCPGPFALKEGDRVYVQHTDCLNGDSIKAGIWGYKMKVAE